MDLFQPFGRRNSNLGKSSSESGIAFKMVFESEKNSWLVISYLQNSGIEPTDSAEEPTLQRDTL
ncbi:hypothetical protein Pla100_11080 [Neorhodopirellula pilleata]|uniref:Uncharacterized protein n=1 Tax=Neorhodopirellula pilleata TaxID=2714738 RepID=A0A5C6APL7_9BACT|nr:hypothetical protein Pla100_11080 [Neorhodopirellula pilleata]